MRKLIFYISLLLIITPSYAQGYNSKRGSHRGYNSPYAQEEYRPSSWSGSGIAISSNYIATNNHVVSGATNLYVFFPETEKQYVAEVVKRDETNDLAIIRISDTSFGGFNSIKYGFKTKPEDVGEEVFVLGYPLISTMGTEIKLTTGVVSSTSGYQGNRNQYQISAPVQSGNSGGPLFNGKGELIGIVSAKHADAENVSYSVKLSYLSQLASGLPGVNLSSSSQLSSQPLSNKVKSIKPSVVMILADNQGPQPKRESTSSFDKGSGWISQSRSNGYPVRINTPQVQLTNSEDTRIIGIELTSRYTAIHLSYTNSKYLDGWYNINNKAYLLDRTTGEKYYLRDTDNCAISPYKTSIEYGQTKHFVLYFDPLPANASLIDLIENINSSGWNFWGISLK